MSVVGSVAVRVVPSFKGLHTSIGRELTGAAASAGRQAGGEMSRTMARSLDMRAVGSKIQDVGRSISGLGDQLTRRVTVPAAAAAAAIGGITLAGGFRRLVGIDTAQAQLKALGHDGESVEDIMTSALDAVKGTAYGLDEAATIAASAVAAGVEPGEQLTGYLTMVGDAAAIAGVDLGEMGSILNQVQTGQMAYTDSLNMLADRGLPIYQWIADEAGVAASEVKQMAADGDVSSELFFKAIEKNIGGAAKVIGEESFMGAWSNVWAAVSRAGASFLDGGGEGGGFFSQLKPLMTEITGLIDDLTPKAEDLGVRFGEFFTTVVERAREAVEWWGALDGETRKWILTAAGLAIAAGPVLIVVGKIVGAIGGLISGIGTVVSWFSRLSTSLLGATSSMRLLPRLLVLAGNGLKVLTGPIGWIVGALIAMWTHSDSLRESVANLGGVLWDAAQRIWESLQPAFGALGDGMVVVGDVIGVVATALGDGLGWVIEHVVIPAVEWLADVIVLAIDWLSGLGDESSEQGGVLQGVFGAIGDACTWLWEYVLKPTWDALVAGWEGLVAAVSWAWVNVLKPVWDAVAAVATWLWVSIIQPVFNFIVGAWQTLATVIAWYWNGILKPVFIFVGDVIRWLWNSVAKPLFARIQERWQILSNAFRIAYNTVIKPVIDWFADKISWLWENAIQPVLGWIGDRWGWLSDRISDFWHNGAKPILEAFGDFVRYEIVDRVQRGVDMIRDAWNAVANFFRTPINWVINTVWNDGIKKAFDNVAEAVGSDARLAAIPNIPEFGASRSNGRRGNIPGYAEGGLAGRGWALVGEEGPELVNFAQPGRVYTADETRQALTGLPADAPIGGAGGTMFIARQLAQNEQVQDTVGGAIEWARGTLADTAERFLKPVLDRVAGFTSEFGLMGQLGSGLIDWGVDQLIDWIRGKDAEAVAEGVYDGTFAANPGGFNRPSGGPITSRYGPRSIPGGYSNFHAGIDLGAPHGSPVRAAWAGVVKRTGWGPGNLGNLIVLNHGGFDTAYGHLSSIGVNAGDRVSGGQRIGAVGATGGNFGPHLHFEQHRPGWYNPVNVNSLFRDKGGLIYPGMNQVLNETGRAEYVFNQRQFENLNRMAASSSGEGWHIEQHNHVSGSQYRDAQDLRFTMRREAKRQKAGV